VNILTDELRLFNSETKNVNLRQVARKQVALAKSRGVYCLRSNHKQQWLSVYGCCEKPNKN